MIGLVKTSSKINTIPTYQNHMIGKLERKVSQASQKKILEATSRVTINAVVIKKRGRPKGAKNKPKVLNIEQAEMPARVKRKYTHKLARPASCVGQSVTPRVKHKARQVESTQPKASSKHSGKQETVEDHPLFLAVKWLEKHMHHAEVQHYRGRASKSGTTVQMAMMSDILGFFNVQDAELCKQVKKNNFIIHSNELHQ